MHQNPSRYAATTWGGSPYTELEVPSGQLCLVRKLQPIDLAAGNLLGASDLLGSVVQQKIAEAKAGPQDHKKPAAEQQAADEAKILEAIGTALSSPEGLDSMVDTIVVKAVVEPRIEMAPKDFTDREEGVVYVDTISFTDKMFVFDWVMKGIDQLKQFRKSAPEDVAAVDSVEGVRRETE